MISYEPLWRTLKQRGISPYQLITDYDISTIALDAFQKNKPVTLHTISKLCQTLDCQLTDIVMCGNRHETVPVNTEKESEKKTCLSPEISYEPFWATLKKKEISLYQFLQTCGISLFTLSAMRNRHSLTTHTLDRICMALQCRVEDVVEFVWMQEEGNRAIGNI